HHSGDNAPGVGFLEFTRFFSHGFPWKLQHASYSRLLCRLSYRGSSTVYETDVGWFCSRGLIGRQVSDKSKQVSGKSQISLIARPVCVQYSLLFLGALAPFGLSVAERSRRPLTGSTLRLRHYRVYAQRERGKLYCIQLKTTIRQVENQPFDLP